MISRDTQDAGQVVQAFFAQLAEGARVWLAGSCSLHADEGASVIGDGNAADLWVGRFMQGGIRSEQNFGRLLQLIAVIDFELSPLAMTRLKADGHDMSHSPVPWLASQGHRTLQDRVPLLNEMITAWRDLRANELDEAALWAYRDELRRREMAGAVCGWTEPQPFTVRSARREGQEIADPARRRR